MVGNYSSIVKEFHLHRDKKIADSHHFFLFVAFGHGLEIKLYPRMAQVAAHTHRQTHTMQMLINPRITYKTPYCLSAKAMSFKE